MSVVRDTSREAHPDGAGTRRILARILVHRAALRSGVPTPEGAIGERNRRVTAALAVADDLALTKLPMSEYVAHVLRPLKAAAPPPLGSGTAESLALATIVTACDGQLRNLQAFLSESIEFHDRSGIGPVNELFEYALELASSRYAKHCHGYSATSRIEVSFSTEIDSDELKGDTAFPKDDSLAVRRSGVRLLMPLADYELSHYLASLYIVFHELFVHAFQALCAPGARGVYGELCPFAEGLVDALAAKVLIADLRSGGKGIPASSAAYIDDIAMETESAHLQRSATVAQQDKSKRPRTEFEQAAIEIRRYGKAVFVRLERFWRVAEAPHNAARIETLVLSLNALSLTLGERRHLLDQIDEAVIGSSNGVRSLRQIRRLAALDDYAASGDENLIRHSFDLTDE